MKILFGHPTGNPNSHHAALSHWENGRLAAFCVPWMPSEATLSLLRASKIFSSQANRLERRRFPPLSDAPKIQGRLGECTRLFKRWYEADKANQSFSYEANDWLMSKMAAKAKGSHVDAVHSYEDCSLKQFEVAKRLGKACIYDMPIGYFEWWHVRRQKLEKEFADWLPGSAQTLTNQFERPAQKKAEMQLADLTLVPSRFVERTIREFYPNQRVSFAPYGVETTFWRPLQPEAAKPAHDGPLRFLFAGQACLRKGTPLLLQAWEKSNLLNATLTLVGKWGLGDHVLKNLPKNVEYIGPKSREALREVYRTSDVFVFPSYFEGFPLSLLEAMSCGLPAIVSQVVQGMELISSETGFQLETNHVDELVGALTHFSQIRERLSRMSSEAVKTVSQYTWEQYRRNVTEAVSVFS